MTRLSEFLYELPEHLIAQRPVEPRDASRLMLLPRAGGLPAHRRFHELPELLGEGDLLVLNDTKVRPARLRGQREPGGGVVELPLTKRREDGSWEALARPGRRLRPGVVLDLGGGRLRGRVLGERGRVRIISLESARGTVEEAIDEVGVAPLPPYIRRDGPDPADRVRYQTVYAREPGAVAAPTAGLHFTPELLERLAARGIGTASLTLHVGWGTFAPIEAEHVEDHRVEPEAFHLPAATLRAVRDARRRGGRVVAVGTTSARALESLPDPLSEVDVRGETGLFIRPPHDFRHVDGLLTNFHLPASSLMALVAALAGLPRLREAYALAVREGYRFYSYGDAMLVL